LWIAVEPASVDYRPLRCERRIADLSEITWRSYDLVTPSMRMTEIRRETPGPAWRIAPRKRLNCVYSPFMRHGAPSPIRHLAVLKEAGLVVTERPVS
jgi:hypothetical protein